MKMQEWKDEALRDKADSEISYNEALEQRTKMETIGQMVSTARQQAELVGQLRKAEVYNTPYWGAFLKHVEATTTALGFHSGAAVSRGSSKVSRGK